GFRPESLLERSPVRPIRVASLAVGATPARSPRNGSSAPTSAPPAGRPHVRGKFLFVGEEKLYVRGVTYGAFQPDADGREYQDLDAIDRDFAPMAANGINPVRIPHTMPPQAVLAIALQQGLWVMVGLIAAQYVGYLLDRPPGA